MRRLSEELESVIATAARLFADRGKNLNARVLESSAAELQLNPDGEYYGNSHTLELTVPQAIYSLASPHIQIVEADLLTMFTELTRVYTDDRIYRVLCTPMLVIDSPHSIRDESRPQIWKPDSLRVFISHVSTERQFASDMAESLGDYGVSSFVAHRDIHPTTPWQDEILYALSTMDTFVALLTPDFIASSWTDQESGYAIARNTYIIPVMRDSVPYGFMARYQGLDAKKLRPMSVAHKVASLLAKHPATKSAMAEDLVSAFEEAGSFEAAKSRVRHLSLAEAFTKNQCSRIESALMENDQISHAWGVKDKVKQLLSEQGFETTFIL